MCAKLKEEIKKSGNAKQNKWWVTKNKRDKDDRKIAKLMVPRE